MQALSTTENVALGVAVGTVEVSILQPMLYCKNATQQGLPLSVNPRLLYRGVSMSIINMSIITGAQFPLTGLCSKLVSGGASRPLSSAEKIWAGFMGGALSGFLCAPMELVMIQQQRHGGSLVHQTRRVLGEFGVSGLFRGLFCACGREGLFTAGYLGLGPVFADSLRDGGYIGNVQVASFVGAAGAGCIAATLSHPLDTVKTCMQGDVEQAGAWPRHRRRGALSHAHPVASPRRQPSVRCARRRPHCPPREPAASSTDGAGGPRG